MRFIISGGFRSVALGFLDANQIASQEFAMRCRKRREVLVSGCFSEAWDRDPAWFANTD